LKRHAANARAAETDRPPPYLSVARGTGQDPSSARIGPFAELMRQRRPHPGTLRCL